MDINDYISERNLEGVKPSGEKINIVVAVGVPYKDEKYESWACPVKVEGLHKNLAAQHGIDSWQALREAQKLVASILTHFIEDGGKLYIFGEREEVTTSEVQKYF
ncbi:DUF6968 family protein [Shewanella chilikensis]|uniref:DUF6968 family protein n=1 Tax=Shewanella chilikensis TaxID=558541 RepID=UPI003A97F81E